MVERLRNEVTPLADEESERLDVENLPRQLAL
jgi:hypothetical protein